MNPRARILATLARQPVDRPPVDLWHTPEVGAALREHTGTGDDLAMYRALGLDKIVWVFPTYPVEPGRTTWGAPLRRVRAGAAEYDEIVTPPLAGIDSPAALDDYPFWPDPERYDVAGAAARAREAARHFAVIGPWVSCFEVYCQLRGLEQGLLDLLLSPDLVAAVLDRVEAIQTELMLRFFREAGPDALDLVFVSDDLGTQQGLLMSPEHWRTHLEPRLRRWCDLVHDHGRRVLFHSDGAVAPLVGPLLDCGVDVLNPVQHACPGMAPATLAEQHGGRVVFHGGVDNQHTLPFGTPDDVRAEVHMLRETLGAGGAGFICCSCHNVQAGTPVENVLAMIEAAGEPLP